MLQLTLDPSLTKRYCTQYSRHKEPHRDTKSRIMARSVAHEHKERHKATKCFTKMQRAAHKNKEPHKDAKSHT
jgi:hypothetical protein